MLPKCVTVGRYIFTQIRVDEDGIQYYSIQLHYLQLSHQQHANSALQSFRDYQQSVLPILY